MPILVWGRTRSRVAPDDGQHSDACNCREHDGESGGETEMSAELLALLRHRVATRFYDQPLVIEQIARAILSHGSR
jgi:hypothetical protein